jgi:hypothetical protein
VDGCVSSPSVLLKVLASRHMRLSVIAQRCSLEHSLDTTGGNRARYMKLEEVCFVNRSIKEEKIFPYNYIRVSSPFMYKQAIRGWA